MGHALNKKFFGNRNLGSDSTAADDKIGGNRIAEVTIDAAGTYAGSLPTASFSAPDLEGAGAITATGVVHGRALSATVNAAGTGYVLDDVVEVVGGTGTAASFTVTVLVTTGATLTAAGSMYDVDGDDKDEIWFDGDGWATPLKIRVDTVTGSNGVATFTVIQQGVWSGPDAAPTSVTGTSTNNGPLDGNGNGAAFTLTYGVNAVSVDAGGDYTAVATNPRTTTGGSGTGAKLNVTYGVDSIEIVETGSGYSSDSDAEIEFSSGTAAATAVLEADAGPVGGPGQNENAVTITAYLPTAGSPGIVEGAGGTAARNSDIVRQSGTRSFIVKNADGVGLVRLAAATPSPGTASIIATDYTGATYYVTKISSRKAYLTRKTQNGSDPWEFESDTMVPWTFDELTSADQNLRVRLSNT